MAISAKDAPPGDTALIKTPPHDAAAEQSLLGSMMLSMEAISDVVESIAVDDFYDESHRAIFEAICKLYADNKPVDPVTVSDELVMRSALDRVGGPEYVQLLINAVPTAANAGYYAGIVKRHAVLRNLIRAATQIATIAYSQPEDTAKAVDEAEQMLFAVSGKRTSDKFVHIKDLLTENLEAMGKDGSAQAIMSGFTDLDKLTSGFNPSDLIVVAARPSMGKTSLALCMAQNIALDQGKTAAIFSLEMSRHQLTQRLLCGEARVNAQDVRRGEISSGTGARLTAAMNRLSQAPIYIDDTPNITLMEIRSKARRLAMHESLGIVVVDYLQLMSGNGRAENRQQEISEISRSLKMLGRELEVPVLAVSQLSRAVEARSDKKPMLSDLRESGAIEQDADMVVFIYRDKYYNPDSEENIAEVMVAKHRNGPTGRVYLTFLDEYAKFENCAPGYREDY